MLEKPAYQLVDYHYDSRNFLFSSVNVYIKKPNRKLSKERREHLRFDVALLTNIVTKCGGTVQEKANSSTKLYIIMEKYDTWTLQQQKEEIEKKGLSCLCGFKISKCIYETIIRKEFVYNKPKEYNAIQYKRRKMTVDEMFGLTPKRSKKGPRK